MNEAELALSHVLNCDRLSLYLNKDIKLNKDNSVLISEILKRRINGEPLQYILGKTEFMGLEFKVDKRALIPRPETEILVEAAVKELKTMGIDSPKIFDLGTGSGCIAISIAKLLPGAIVWAADISEEALQLAAANAELNKAEIKFFRSDIFSAPELKNKQFDLIISNPPYVAASALSSLAKEISFEPECALAAGIQGLDFYRKIIKEAPGYLNKHGWLAFEAGMGQAEAISKMLKNNFSGIRIIKDYNKIKRIIIARQL